MKKVFPLIFLSVILSSLASAANSIPKLNATTQIALSQGLQQFSQAFFKAPVQLSVSDFIILIVIWILFFVIISDIFKLTPFLKGKLSWICGALVAIIISVTGVNYTILNFLLGFQATFTAIQSLGKVWSFILIIAIIILIIIVTLLWTALVSPIIRKTELDKAKKEGAELGIHLKFISWLRKGLSGNI